MNQRRRSLYLAISCLIIVLIPIGINFLMFWNTPFPVARNNEWISFFSNYLSGIIGGLIGGLFTYLGVKLTLDNQEDKEIIVKRNHLRMLLSQLQFTHDMFKSVPPNAELSINTVILDPQWYQHLTFSDSLDSEEFRDVINWFYNMSQIEKQALGSPNNTLKAQYVLKLIEKLIPKISVVMDKLRMEIGHNT